MFKIVDIWTHFKDIHGQSQKLYEIASSLGRFLFYQISRGGGAPKKLYMA